jgi:tRNA U38,U39,U40 pseudouridine synthase TruA
MPSKMSHHSFRKCLATVVAAVRTDMGVVEVVDMVEEEAAEVEEGVADVVMEMVEATVEVEAMAVVEEEVVVDIAMDGKRYLMSMHPSGMTNDESYAPFETSASFWTTLFISRFGMRSPTLQPLFVIDQNPITNTRTFTRYWM